METLLKFIINNPFVAIIILGFLISMFGNKNKKAGMPPFGGGKQANQGRPLEQQPDRSAEQRTHETHADRSRPYPNRFDRSEEQDWIPEQPAASSAVQPERTALEHRLQESARLREGQRASSRRPDSGLPRKQSAHSAKPGYQLAEPGAGLPREEEMRRAIVWAEILGPPRAKRRRHR
ncbi:hypothetical protein [Paenibacillus pinihumi]|uniref:hypothetical protein n=1 Tax=Paenibacillus pinihumi TaxID=669462 RepID=UPI0004036806|nr:hypothetical protein [Paenibacillus pinihumi]